MPHHFTKATIEATVWCKKCGKPTPHLIYDGRRGSCKICIARLEEEAARREKESAANLKLF